MRVAVQQRHRLYREGLAELLAAERDLCVVGRVETAAELVALCDRAVPDVAVLDWDGRDAPPRETARRLRRDDPSLRLVVLRDQRDRSGGDAVRWPGVQIVRRGAGVAGIIDAIRAPRPVHAVPSMSAAPPPGGRRLTPREQAVLGLISMGCTSQEIALRLNISRKTVDNHKQRMFAKLAVQNQAHAVAVAIRRGMLMPQPFVGAASAS